MKRVDLPQRYPDLADMADGDADLVLDLLDMFLFQTPDLMGQLESALDSGDRTRIYAASHTLKPTLRYLGKDNLAVLAERVELGARDETTGLEQVEVDGRTLCTGLKALIHQVEEEVKSVRAVDSVDSPKEPPQN